MYIIGVFSRNLKFWPVEALLSSSLLIWICQTFLSHQGTGLGWNCFQHSMGLRKPWENLGSCVFCCKVLPLITD